MVKWWNSQEQTQEFEYDELGNYVKTLTITKYENTKYYFLYDKNPNILSKIIPCRFFARVIYVGPFWSDFISASNNNPTIFNSKAEITENSVPDYIYEYNSNGYPIKRSSGAGNANPMTLEYIY